MTHRLFFVAAAGLTALSISACQPAADTKTDPAATGGAMAPADGAMAPADSAMAPSQDKMAPADGAMAPAQDKMAPQH